MVAINSVTFHGPNWHASEKIELAFTHVWNPVDRSTVVAEALRFMGEPKAHVSMVMNGGQHVAEFDIAVGERVWLTDESHMPSLVSWIEVQRTK